MTHSSFEYCEFKNEYNEKCYEKKDYWILQYTINLSFFFKVNMFYYISKSIASTLNGLEKYKTVFLWRILMILWMIIEWIN